jgi:hypothetical protein
MKFIYYLSETKYFVTDLYRADNRDHWQIMAGWVQPNRRLLHGDDEAASQETIIDCKALEFLRLFARNKPMDKVQNKECKSSPATRHGGAWGGEEV